MRPVDADEAKRIAREYLTDPYHVISAVAVLDKTPTLTQPNEWVSVDERLPGVSGNYICAVKDKNGSVWTIPAEWSLEMKMWIGAFGEIKNIVTHWMSLPEPPDRRPPEGEA